MRPDRGFLLLLGQLMTYISNFVRSFSTLDKLRETDGLTKLTNLASSSSFPIRCFETCEANNGHTHGIWSIPQNTLHLYYSYYYYKTKIHTYTTLLFLLAL
ncbi:uncharacterized protein F4812DRAFT_346616 [Daldinia caldariorum]|uniref:uncharacterized protein n=1 Tax=Daldinia caldariorum TaxID=326644 RepID=UPI002007CAA0|nr:uncharacterized protein F4812DRAFT_346616 [Daldinia caldariorum]KAI1468780.1 hypothetical protein F4812DRAFT_346616 [Daldinia caldariorum]